MTRLIPSPLGPLRAGATGEGLCLLEFAGGRARGNREPDPLPLGGENPWLARVGEELGEYFARRRREFTVPLITRGSSFQERVWRALRDIPFGRTVTYLELARRAGSPRGVRAVGTANGKNPIVILVPCHRVVNTGGGLGGFGGGLWRKEWLLRFEDEVTLFR